MDRKRFLTMIGGLSAVALLAGAAIATQADPPRATAREHHGPPPAARFSAPGMMAPGALPHLAKQ